MNNLFKLIEQVDRPGQEEFIWAMRSRAYTSDDDLWRERRLRSHSMGGDVEPGKIFDLPTTSAAVSGEFDNNTKKLCSFLPDELLIDPNNYNDRIYEAAVVIGCITGFSTLWERYRAIGKGGPLRMTHILNMYVGNIMQEAFVYNGDVIKYTGNSIVVMWKQGTRSMPDCVHQALDFTLSIVKNYSNYETDIGVKIDVKFSISCGTVIFSAIGCKRASSFVLTGKPLEETKEMLSKVGNNEVIINLTAWDHLNSIEYISQLFDEENDYFLISDYSSAWRSIQEASDKPELFNTELLSESYTSVTQITVRREIHDIYELRPCIGDAVNMKIYTELKCFVFPTLIQTIEANEPIDNLIEMRYIVIMVASFTLDAQNYHDVIRLADLFYRMINNIIEPYHGYVNKVHYVENELSYIVIFGIRSKKYELESRNALIAATKCYKGAENVSYVGCCALAVVTGLVYCGPIGHHLRREYTIIGSNLNKGRRLVIEFPNKVTCDRETFLQSKIESRHFILQEFKQIHGIAEYGPIYEYVEFDMTTNHLPKFVLNKCPLLDREFEMNTYRTMLLNFNVTLKCPEFDRFKRLYEPSGLFIIAEPHQGVSRLTEEMLSVTPMETPMFRLRLSSLDKSVPYQAIYFFFGIPLGIADNSTTSDREAKLISKLRNVPLNGLECLLNVVFRVNFAKSTMLTSLTPAERFLILQNIIKHLCHVCFSKKWIIIIDGGEYIDNESWDLLYSILETHSILLVAGISCIISDLPDNARDYLSRTKCQCLKLLPIDKLYHAALACQMMDCIGIPVELEKMLHDKSQGNPGWMENFILSLIHSNIIWLRKVSATREYRIKLVMPPRAQLVRNTTIFHPQVLVRTKMTLHPAILLNQWKWNVFERVGKADDSSNGDDHELYEEALRSSLLRGQGELIIRESATQQQPNLSRKSVGANVAKKNNYKSVVDSSALHSIMGEENQMIRSIEVCLLSPGGEAMLSSYDADFLNTYYVTHIMDSLSAFELSVLKCASVIGDYFLRDMLIYIMTKQDERATAIACQRLFEVGVIGCAGGDFRRTLTNYAPLTTDHYKVFEDNLIQCNCIGFLESESCRDLQSYGNCGFMRFRNVEFRQAAYNLLTVEQMNDLHLKSLHYLEKRSRKCTSCGAGAFTKILGNRYEEGALAQRKKRIVALGAGRTGRSSATLLEDWDFLTHKNSNSWSKVSGIRRNTANASFLNVQKNENEGIFREFTKSALTGNDAKTIPTFDRWDFTCCECGKILRCLYYYIRKHCEVTGQYEKWMHATLEYSVLCTEDYNFPLALQYLTSALEVLNGPYKSVVREGETWKYDVMKARILTEIGRARAELGQTRLAYTAYEEALQNYGYSLPRQSSLRCKLMEFKQYMMLSFKSRQGIGTKFGYIAEFCDSVSNCLYMMIDLFITLDMWENAYIASMWCLKKALQSEKNFITLINAFTKIIYVSGRMKKFGHIDALEVMSLDYCRRYRCNIDVNDLRSVAELYAAIFYTRAQRARFDDALAIGVSLDTLTDMLHLRSLLIQLFPMFFEILLIRMEANDIYNALATYEQVSAESGDYLGDVWYYSLCVYFHLQTGYMYISVKICEEYYYTQCKRLRTLKEPEAERRYFVAIWLWNLRTENYDLADIWEQKLPVEWKVRTNETVNNLITTLMYIEGLILTVTFKMDRKIVFVIEKMYDKIAALITKMEIHAQTIKIIGPRLYHLKAYFNMCKMNEYDAWDILYKAIKLARSSNNLYDAAWAEHSGRAWKQNMPLVEFTCWKDHAAYDVMDYHEMEASNYKITFFTLELPLYV